VITGICDRASGLCNCFLGFTHKSASEGGCGLYVNSTDSTPPHTYVSDGPTYANGSAEVVHKFQTSYRDSNNNSFTSHNIYKCSHSGYKPVFLTKSIMKKFVDGCEDSSFNSSTRTRPASDGVTSYEYTNVYLHPFTLIVGNKYRLLRKLGAGGFGVIFEGKLIPCVRETLTMTLSQAFLFPST
jgi:hypothetical protein